MEHTGRATKYDMLSQSSYGVTSKYMYRNEHYNGDLSYRFSVFISRANSHIQPYSNSYRIKSKTDDGTLKPNYFMIKIYTATSTYLQWQDIKC